jgi:hypothetical protein
MPKDIAKVSGYIPEDLYQKVLAFKEHRNLRSVSQALIVILTEYFVADGTKVATGHLPLERLESLETKVGDVREQLAALTQAILVLHVSNAAQGRSVGKGTEGLGEDE